MYDLIGDIHGHADELEQLLQKLGYVKNQKGAYQHPNRKVIFAGDFIDRGPKVREVLQIAKAMTDAGSALSVMGNHEFNVICYHTKNELGEYLRPHTDKNRKQQRATEDAFRDYPEEWEMYLEWMMRLPIWLDLNELRVIHACWHSGHLEKVKEALKGNTLTPDFLQAAAIEGTWEYESIEILLKGIEKELPEGQYFLDKDGHRRSAMRIQWWKSPQRLTQQEYGIGSTFADVPIPIEWGNNFYYSEKEIPVFIGHYWLKGEVCLRSPSVCCLDFSVAKGGKLVAYRWNVGELLSDDNFFF